jgi:FixJ family two-component response regulator
MSAEQRVHVRFEVEDDDAASKIDALLTTLGYVTERAGGSNTLRWKLDQIERRFHLSATERQVLELLIQDRNFAQIADELNTSRAQAKWLRHALIAKTRAGSMPGLMRLVMEYAEPASEGA